MAVIDTQQTSPSVPPASADVARPKVVIAPARGWFNLKLQELWDYRELFFFLIWRDVKVRYKQTLLGATWAIIQPVLQMVVFTVIFGRLAGIDSGDIPYPLFNYAALLPWQLFSTAIGSAANSLVQSSALVRKVYFPRLAVPSASVLAGLVDFGLAFLVLIGLMVYFGWAQALSLRLLALPLFLLLALITALGVGYWLSALNAQYRDIRHATPFLVQIWLFATPIVYPANLLDERWQLIYALNPMVGVVEGFRWSLLGTDPPGAMVLVSTVMALIGFVSGLAYFQATERKFADII